MGKITLWGVMLMLLTGIAAQPAAAKGRKIVLIAGTMTGHDKYTH